MHATDGLRAVWSYSRWLQSKKTQFAAGEEQSIWLLRNCATSLWMKISLQMFVWLQIFPGSLFTGHVIGFLSSVRFMVLSGRHKTSAFTDSILASLTNTSKYMSKHQNASNIHYSQLCEVIRRPPHTDRFLCWKHRWKSEKYNHWIHQSVTPYLQSMFHSTSSPHFPLRENLFFQDVPHVILCALNHFRFPTSPFSLHFNMPQNPPQKNIVSVSKKDVIKALHLNFSLL